MTLSNQFNTMKEDIDGVVFPFGDLSASSFVEKHLTPYSEDEQLERANEVLDQLYKKHLFCSGEQPDIQRVVGLTVRMLEILLTHPKTPELADKYVNVLHFPENHPFSSPLHYMWHAIFFNFVDNPNISSTWFEVIFEKATQSDPSYQKSNIERMSKKPCSENAQARRVDLVKRGLAMLPKHMFDDLSKELISQALRDRDQQLMEFVSQALPSDIVYNTVRDYEREWAQKTPILQSILDQEEMKKAIEMPTLHANKRKF